MCGIIGGTKKDWNFDEGVKTLYHRGPDSQAIIYHPDLSLGFTRLAIIDLSREADQPMITADQTIRIVFNGEIYGYKVLREDLISKGYFFRTHSDTEVILNAYREWKDDFVEHLDGMFAIAIHDLRTRELKLLRDRAGIKPLYYYFDGKEFAFASELKGITAMCSDVAFSHDTTALYDFLTYYYIPDPKTLYQNVFKLLPAHQLTFDLASRSIRSLKPYWKLNIPSEENTNLSIPAVTEQLRALIRESVKDQLVADVPVGCFLSGGMDSSIITAEASSFKPNLETFTIGFDNPRYTETAFAAEVAKAFNTHHKTKTLSSRQADDLFKRLKTWYDEPFADTSAFPTFLVSEFARQNMPVALTGDGGDEIFGGYSRVKMYHLFSKFPRLKNERFNNFFALKKNHCVDQSIPHKFFYGMELLTADDFRLYTILMAAMTSVEKKSFAQRWGIPHNYDNYWYFRKHYRIDLPPLKRLQYLDFHTYLPSGILTKVDRVSMAVSLECRVPFLSRKIIEFVFSLPEDVLYLNGQLKGLLKETYKNILPKSILTRRKMGFGIPSQYLNQDKERIQFRILREVFGISC